MKLEIITTAGNERLDRYLAAQLPDLSRSRIQQLIAQGQVYVNGQLCQAKKQMVQVGDRIKLELPPPVAAEPLPKHIPLDILYEDDQRPLSPLWRFTWNWWGTATGNCPPPG